jgi:hypothetical protein
MRRRAAIMAVFMGWTVATAPVLLLQTPRVYVLIRVVSCRRMQIDPLGHRWIARNLHSILGCADTVAYWTTKGTAASSASRAPKIPWWCYALSTPTHPCQSQDNYA